MEMHEFKALVSVLVTLAMGLELGQERAFFGDVSTHEADMASRVRLIQTMQGWTMGLENADLGGDYSNGEAPGFLVYGRGNTASEAFAALCAAIQRKHNARACALRGRDIAATVEAYEGAEG